MQAQATELSQTSVLEFKRADFNKIRDRLGWILWMEILEGKTLQDTWETLKN